MTLSPPVVPLRKGTIFSVSAANATASRVRILGTTVVMVHRLDADEHHHRLKHGIGPLTSMELLDQLMALPAHAAVPRASLNASVLRLLRSAPRGVVEFERTSVVRRSIPATTPLLAVVYANRWRDGLARASRFASYCPRMLVVRSLPEDATEALAEASWYGIGVAVGPPRSPTLMLEPEPVDDWQPTPAWWCFCELVYGQLGQS